MWLEMDSLSGRWWCLPGCPGRLLLTEDRGKSEERRKKGDVGVLLLLAAKRRGRVGKERGRERWCLAAAGCREGGVALLLKSNIYGTVKYSLGRCVTFHSINILCKFSLSFKLWAIYTRVMLQLISEPAWLVIFWVFSKLFTWHLFLVS